MVCTLTGHQNDIKNVKSLTCGSTWVLNILASDLQPTCIRVAMGNKIVFCFVEIKTINNLHMTFFYYCACLTWNNIFSTGLHGKRSSMILNSFSCQILSPPPPPMFPNQANGQSHTAFLQDYFLCSSWEKIIINLCFKRIKQLSFANTNNIQNRTQNFLIIPQQKTHLNKCTFFAHLERLD